ncbi:acyl-homoserine-lactone synthase [Burkholderia sp. Bp8986]|uniref:acyl-homoserine-lactone synthase n=1 Tax=Burkholderia sp. Bp8986 TaxID=2184550 RepID=UPI000F58F4B3|nr:acyl-homoserine-lactone synthase [Burkholderia sp. Bp8986]RQS56184.1 GNAT family N-acetyltransferase [Burkholderia sp. Bp8986]
MRTFVHDEGRLPHELAADLGRYRRHVFVEQLGWALPSANECFERDQFDRDDTVYVFARNACGEVCGCARLLPTTRPYLLKSLFADLIAEDVALPQSAAVWELSRFAATGNDEGGPGNAEWAVRPMLAAVVECAAQRGARQLIGVTFASMERLFRRIGVHAHRAGPPKQVDGRLVVACWIDIDPQTFAALGIEPGRAARQAIAA